MNLNLPNSIRVINPDGSISIGTTELTMRDLYKNALDIYAQQLRTKLTDKKIILLNQQNKKQEAEIYISSTSKLLHENPATYAPLFMSESKKMEQKKEIIQQANMYIDIMSRDIESLERSLNRYDDFIQQVPNTPATQELKNELNEQMQNLIDEGE